jgi:rhodanese-related sulfurtransferase
MIMNRRTLMTALAALPFAATAKAQTPLPQTPVPQIPATQIPAPHSISVREAHERAKAGTSVLIDIRRPEEWADTGVAEGAIKLDMTSPLFEARLATIRSENPGKPIDMICRTANRTRDVQMQLSRRGWTNLVNVRGGMLGNPGNPGWLDEKLPLQKP